jgi:glycosyltransferase involved in cell wall biosynthesis
MRRAARIACISKYTFDDVRRILKTGRNLCVILDALNYPYQSLPAGEADRRVAGLHEIKNPFILHVGSNETRKNREGVLRIFAKVLEKANLQLVFAGAALSQPLLRLADELKISDRIVQVVRPNAEIIEALYNRAAVLLFPSRYEGFGWPPIEAQACGCPVVGSQIPPLVEVLGSSAVLLPVDEEAGMAESIIKLASDEGYRAQMRQLGFDNVRSRFQTSRMMNEYLSLYKELLSQ